MSEKVNNEENDALFVNKQLRVRPPTASRPTTIKEISKSSTGEEVARAEDYDLRNLMESPNVTEFMFLNQLDPNNYAPDLSENDRATEGTPSKSNAPATVRRKLNTKYIENRTKRMICFSKRKMGLLNKAHYIHLFTGCEILVIIASETGNAYTYASPRLKPIITEEKGQSMIRTLLNNPREKIGSRSAKGTASLKEKLSGTQDVNEHVDFTDPNSTRMKKVSEKLLPMVRVSEDNDSVEIDHAISWQQPENLEEKSNYDEAKIVNEPQSIFSEDDTLSCTNFEQKNVDRTKNQAISSPHRFRNRQKLRNRRLKPYLRRQNPSNERLPDNKATNQVKNENVNQVSQEASSSLPPDSHATFRFDEEDLDFSQYLPQPSEVLMVPNEKHKRSKKDIQFNEIHSYHDFPTHLRMPMPQMSFEEYMSRQNQFMMGYTQRYAPPSNFPPRAHPHMPPNFPQGPPPWYNGHPNYGMISGPYTTNVSPAISPLQHSHPINSMKQVNSIVHNSIPQNTAESSRNNRSSQDYLKESNYQRECDGTHGYSRETAGETNSARDNLDYYQTFKSTDDQPPTSSYHNNNLE